MNDAASCGLRDHRATAIVRLKPGKEKAFFARHPWVRHTAIASIEGDPQDGAVVDLVSSKDRFVGRGIFNSKSRLRVRLYAWNPDEPLDDVFWRRRVENALRLRDDLGWSDGEQACRLIYSESDGLSGLVLDRYAGHLVMQINALGMQVRLPIFVALLAEMLRPKSILVRSEVGTERVEGIEPRQECAWGRAPDGPVFVVEHGLRYGVDLISGQKTGFYLDQRENRRAAAAYVRGRRVLDLFCYCGGFSLCASRLGGAREVLGIDSSERAITWARANAELNAVGNVRFQAMSVFKALDSLVLAEERFGAVILDPPKFAKSRFQVERALGAYHRINRLAVQLLQPGGILVTSSCSGSVTGEEFLAMLSGVAQKAGREIQVLEQRGAAADHPVSLSCPQTSYLKCLVCRVV